MQCIDVLSFTSSKFDCPNPPVVQWDIPTQSPLPVNWNTGSPDVAKSTQMQLDALWMRDYGSMG